MTDSHAPRRRNAREDDSTPLLSVTDLRTVIRTAEGPLHAVDGVSFSVRPGETVCIVGESGSGKSITCRSVTRLLPSAAEIVGGELTLGERSLRALPPEELESIRGDRIAHVFQNPQRSLDPVYPVGEQITETIRIHTATPSEEGRRRALTLLRRVGIPRAHERIDDYPHEFSGGMQQRVAVAIALAGEPEILVADEPTTAVDATVQARLIELFRSLTDEGTALLLVTHDLRIVSALADRVLVMYAGTVVERGPVERVFDRPLHPYTQALFRSYDATADRESAPPRRTIPADGCRFRPACPHAVERCAGGDQPTFQGHGTDHEVSCVHFEPDADATAVLADARRSSPGRAMEPRRDGEGTQDEGSEGPEGPGAMGEPE